MYTNRTVSHGARFILNQQEKIVSMLKSFTRKLRHENIRLNIVDANIHELGAVKAKAPLDIFAVKANRNLQDLSRVSWSSGRATFFQRLRF